MVSVHLRPLKESDAQDMLSWMHDHDLVKDLQADFEHKTLDDALEFIKMAQNSNRDIHMAISDESGTYYGTVSLKHIDPTKKQAEFGICCTRAALGKGISSSGMKQILDKGFAELGLERIFWCVSPDNERAVRFYDKNGYARYVPREPVEGYSPKDQGYYLWFEARK